MSQLDESPVPAPMPELAPAQVPAQVPARMNRPRDVVLAVMMFAGLVGVVGSKLATGEGYQPPLFGLPDPGPLTALGLPVAQYVAELAGIGVVGSLFIRLLLTHRRPPGSSTGSARVVQQHLSTMAVRWAALWVASTLAWIAFTLSDLVGVPVSELPQHFDLVVIVMRTDRILAEVATLWIALAITMFGARGVGLIAGLVTMTAAAAGLLPSALLGHAAHHKATALAPYALGVHIVAAAVWVGGLIALIVHLRHHPVQLRACLPRFSTAALICVALIGVSGVLESFQMLDGWPALWTTNRGYLLLAKAVALVILALYGYRHRTRTMGAAASGRLAPLLRLAASELALMGATVGIAVALATTA